MREVYTSYRHYVRMVRWLHKQERHWLASGENATAANTRFSRMHMTWTAIDLRKRLRNKLNRTEGTLCETII